jgi:hypothetical protein
VQARALLCLEVVCAGWSVFVVFSRYQSSRSIALNETRAAHRNACVDGIMDVTFLKSAARRSGSGFRGKAEQGRKGGGGGG